MQAVVFDLDGVLVDSEPIYLELSRRLVAPAELPEADFARFIGTHGMRHWLHERYGLPIDEIVPRLRELQHAYLAAAPPTAVDGAGELTDEIRGRGLPLGVASQSDCDWIEGMLAGAGLAPAFSALVSAEEVDRGKPAPDVYLRAAELLGAEPVACIAVEDSPHGVASALAAGMTVVQSRQTSHPFPRQPGVAAVVDSLRDFEVAWLDGAWPARDEPTGGMLDRAPAPR